MATVKSLEQRRAEKAWNFIGSVEKELDKMSPHIKKLPAMILTSGFGQAVAFYLSKDDHKKIIDNVAQVISHLTGIQGITCGNDLLQKIMHSNHETYILLSQEALKYSSWLKRLTEAKMGG